MASLGHVAAGLCVGRVYRGRSLRQSLAWMAVFAALALLPDLDYLPVALGAPNSGPCGHRGATHSLAFALGVSALAAFVAARSRLRAWPIALATFLSIASHPLLDAMTTTSRGVPLLWPFSFHRFEAPWRPFPDPPCGLALISREGFRVATIEMVQFLPILGYALWPGRRSSGKRLPVDHPLPPLLTDG